MSTTNSLSIDTLTVSTIVSFSTITASTIRTTGPSIAIGQNVSNPNRFVEIRSDIANSSYLDFHSSDSAVPDFSTRIQSLGGATSGTGALNMTASTMGLMANVGIGTTIPQAPLHVYNALGVSLSNTNTVNYTQSAILGFNFGGGAVVGTRDSFRILSQTVNRDNGAGPTFFDYGAQADLIFQRKTNNLYSNGVNDKTYTEVMRLGGATGNVGIGTNAPSASLHIYNSSASFTAAPTVLIGDGQTDAGGTYGMVQLVRANTAADNKANLAFIKNGLSLFGMGYYPGAGLSAFGLVPSFSTMATTMGLWILTNGNVGIGITTPSVPLHVGVYGYGNIGGGNWTASNFNSALSAIYNTSQNISAYFLGYASSSIGFLTYSDKRVKKDIEPATNCLDTVLQLQPVTYRKKNVIEDGNELHTGFIAQDVEQVYPSAIHKRTDTIPSIYEIRHAVLIERGIQITESIDVPLNARVVVIDFRNKKIQMIHHPNNILLFENQSDTIELDGDKVFIFGHEVSDKLMLNHDTLFAVGMGAIKELAQKHDALTATCAVLQARMDALEARLAS
jgi:hypothetical protein